MFEAPGLDQIQAAHANGWSDLEMTMMRMSAADVAQWFSNSIVMYNKRPAIISKVLPQAGYSNMYAKGVSYRTRIAIRYVHFNAQGEMLWDTSMTASGGYIQEPWDPTKIEIPVFERGWQEFEYGGKTRVGYMCRSLRRSYCRGLVPESYSEANHSNTLWVIAQPRDDFFGYGNIDSAWRSQILMSMVYHRLMTKRPVMHALTDAQFRNTFDGGASLPVRKEFLVTPRKIYYRMEPIATFLGNKNDIKIITSTVFHQEIRDILPGIQYKFG